jgi:hypothetical protein
VWEISPDLSKRFAVNGNGKPQIVTNHLLSSFDAKHLPDGNSFDRYRRLQKELADRKGKVTPQEASTINLCVAVPGGTLNAATLWHSVYDLKSKTMSVSFFMGKTKGGAERRTPYLPFKL